MNTQLLGWWLFYKGNDTPAPQPYEITAYLDEYVKKGEQRIWDEMAPHMSGFCAECPRP